MKLVMPLGRDKMVSAADFDAEPRFGCACSSVNGTWLTDSVRINSTDPLPFNCMCQCSYGSANYTANYELGFNSNEW